MSLLDLKAKQSKRRTTNMVLRGEIATPIATPAPAPETDMRRRQRIEIGPDGPVGKWVPGFFDCYRHLPFLGSPEAEIQLESARAKWRLEHGEAVDGC